MVAYKSQIKENETLQATVQSLRAAASKKKKEPTSSQSEEESGAEADAVDEVLLDFMPSIRRRFRSC